MAAESRLLQQETGVIQLLMERADALGMVSDSLCQRASLMASCCFPSDEELEKSEMEDVRTGKKKKRSGSFQGEAPIYLSYDLGVVLNQSLYLLSKIRFLPVQASELRPHRAVATLRGQRAYLIILQC